jgi:RNA polymerase sigma-70 factor (ECF subfamily)
MDATAPNHFADSAETHELLMQISAGHRDAFDDLFNRHRGELRRAVELRLDRRLRARVDASDIVQEAQMEAFRRLDETKSTRIGRRPYPTAA